MARIEPQKPDQTFNRSREFQREVLAYLKEHGPQPYDVLYVHFDPNRTAEIQAVLHELIQWKFIDRGTDSYTTVSITTSGIARLGLKDIWHAALGLQGYVHRERIPLSLLRDELGKLRYDAASPWITQWQAGCRCGSRLCQSRRSSQGRVTAYTRLTGMRWSEGMCEMRPPDTGRVSTTPVKRRLWWGRGSSW